MDTCIAADAVGGDTIASVAATAEYAALATALTDQDLARGFGDTVSNIFLGDDVAAGFKPCSADILCLNVACCFQMNAFWNRAGVVGGLG